MSLLQAKHKPRALAELELKLPLGRTLLSQILHVSGSTGNPFLNVPPAVCPTEILVPLLP